MKNFEYASPRTESEVLELLTDDVETELLAGGTDLVGLMRKMIVTPDRVVNIMDVESLKQIEPTDEGGLAIGAAVTLDDILAHPYLENYPAITDATGHDQDEGAEPDQQSHGGNHADNSSRYRRRVVGCSGSMDRFHGTKRRYLALAAPPCFSGSYLAKRRYGVSKLREMIATTTFLRSEASARAAGTHVAPQQQTSAASYVAKRPR